MSLELGSVASFPSTALGRVAEVQLGKMLQTAPSSPGDLEVHYLRAGSLEDLTGAESLRKMWASPADRAIYTVRQGDLIVAEGGDAGRSAFVPQVPADTIIQNSLHRVRPRSGDVRFLKYALDAVYVSGWLDVLCNKATFGHLTREKLTALSIPWPSDNQQRVIADFLDAETDRIDALIAKKRRLAALVEARFSRAVETEVEHLVEEHGTIPLKRLTAVTVGIVIQPSRWYVEEGGVAALRGVNISPGHLDLNELVRISEEGHRTNTKSRLHEGDLVVVRTGDAGAAVVVPPFLDGANCIDLLVIRKSPDLDSEFLRFVLNSGWSKRQITRGSVGTIQSHFNVESLRELPVPYVPLDVQRNLRRRLDAESVRVGQIISKLRRQLALLTEHRQALITAAVTGQIEVPGANARVS